ncbi:MAG: hypothetical protein EOO44_03950 [Flavobacterium sp.]|nr:MAG: hypothetical protein EOO44_03950 [Flavobacterium sp.]
MKKVVFLILVIFLSCKSEEKPLLIEYRNMALHDIKADSIKKFGFGLPLPPRDSIEMYRNNQKKDIYKKYGLYIKNLGCVVGLKELDEASNEYRKITDVYLEKRNGKRWEEKMKTELDNVK